MNFVHHLDSPLGKLLLSADETGLTGIWFQEQKYFANGLNTEAKETDLPVFDQTKQWLSLYFSGREPDFLPPLHLIGTPFQLEVWDLLLKIPYGVTTTYGALAKKLADAHGLPKMSAQAVGGTVGHNKISILIPCHRVIGSNGSLTGYAGGIWRKEALLNLEQKHLLIAQPQPYRLP